MSLEADIRSDTNLTPTRFLLECGELTPSMSLTFDQPFNPFEASYKFLNPGTPKTESDFFSDYKARPDSIMELADSHSPSSQQQNLASELHHLWSDMVSDEACMPLRQMSSEMSSSSSLSTYPASSSSYSSSSSTPPLSSSSARSSISEHSRSRMQSMTSDYMSPISYSTSYPHTHEFTLDTFAASATKYYSDQELPSLAPDSPTPDSLVPSDTFQPGFDMTKYNQTALYDRSAVGDKYDQEMSDQHDSGMDVDSNESQDEDDMSSKGRSESRDPIPRETAPTTRSTRSGAAAAKKSKTQKASKPSRTKKSSSKTEKSSRGQSSRAAAGRSSSSSSKSTTKSPRLNRKHSSPDEEESQEVKRQRFLERNRMAASKCREKKRQQTLKTISDADEITARNHALHKSLDELQEEVRSLKNQILCHRDCGCDVIQKFVQTTMGGGSTKFPRQR
ncbi:hypothetical protein EMPS_08953 [Entomortierella parvispora]|uniref:BZIP domain-containing protein n=1 Tax=Entomortierella parvispora TaxID=205924 RepID=A0A9P3HH19_9FUNG|nr:hypothetical protein EMPS_08953 [Entomortierella parvispora]